MSDDLPPDPFPGDPFEPGKPDRSEAAGEVPAGAGGADPFAAFGMLGAMFTDFAKMMSAQTGGSRMRWDTARQIAMWSATEGQSEPNVDPLARASLEDLARVAEMHVREAAGLDVSEGGRGVGIDALTRSAWALRVLDEQKPLLEALSSLTAGVAPGDPAGGGIGGSGRPGAFDPANPEAFLSSILGLIQPALVGMQTGSMAGHLARTNFGSYDLPLPRAGAGDRLSLIPANIDAFASEWSLPPDAVRMRVLVGEMTQHAVLRVPHVADRLRTLLTRYASGYTLDVAGLEERFEALLGGADPSDPAAMTRALGDPNAMLDAVVTPAQRDTAREIAHVATVLTGWVEHVVAAVSDRLLGGDRRLGEAVRRRRITASSGDRMVERLVGLSLDQALFERGATFVRGVVERAGDDALVRLWTDARSFPTASEVDAPGLWLARLELDS